MANGLVVKPTDISFGEQETAVYSGPVANDPTSVRRISVLRPRTKEQYYDLIAVKLVPGHIYLMLGSTFDTYADRLCRPCLFDITPRAIAALIHDAYPPKELTWPLR